MARSEKKTKIKGLPPIVRLTELGSLQGSYPSVNRDVRTGSIVFQDQDTIRFSTGDIYYGVNVLSGSRLMDSVVGLTSSLTGSGRVVAGISDTFLTYSSPVPSTPFVDGGDPAVDAISTGSVSNVFYATGSKLEGFSGPLWSKDKIEIDFSPRTASSLSGSNGHWMGYFNFNAGRWEGLGTGGAPGTNFVIGGSEYDPIRIGFTPSYHTLFNIETGIKGKPFSNFGFPFDSIFQATSSQLLNVSQFINKPFIVEKVVVQVSASYSKGSGTDLFYGPDCLDYDNQPLYGNTGRFISSSYVVNNFFILNQRRGNAANENIFVYDIGGENLVYLRPTSNIRGTIRDLVTWFEVASFNNDYDYVTSSATNPNAFYRDYTIINTGSVNAFSASWSANIVMSSSVKSPNYTPIDEFIGIGSFADIDVTLIQYPLAWLGSRSGLAGVRASGRDTKNPIGKFMGQTAGGQIISAPPEGWARENPYLLLPGDQLVFGWQVPAIDYANPWNVNLSDITASVAHFPVAPAKVTLYGSYVADGEPVTETTQVLSSDSIHEALK